jgi:hypothetical protein
MEETYLLSMRCPVFRGRDPDLGFRAELENLDRVVKAKSTSADPERPKVPMRSAGADCQMEPGWFVGKCGSIRNLCSSQTNPLRSVVATPQEPPY